MFKSATILLALQAATSPVKHVPEAAKDNAKQVADVAEPVRRTPSLSRKEAKDLPTREVADRTFGQLSDAIVAVRRPGGYLSSIVRLSGLELLLQPTGASIGGLCRSTAVMVRFGEEDGPGTIPQPSNHRTGRRANDVSARYVYKAVGPFHRLKSVQAQYGWDAACGQRRDVTSFMGTNLPNEHSIIPALFAMKAALSKQKNWTGLSSLDADAAPKRDYSQLLRIENVASITGNVEGNHIGAVTALFAPNAIDDGFGLKVTVQDVSWRWPPLKSSDYGVPVVSIGAVSVQKHLVLYD